MNALPPLSDAAAGLWPDAARTVRLVRRLSGFYLVLALALLLSLLPRSIPLLLEWQSSGLGGVAACAIMLPLTGLLATLPLTVARNRLGQTGTTPLLPPISLPMPGRSRFRRLAFRPVQRYDIDQYARLARLARRPQGIIVPVLSLCAATIAWYARSGSADPTAGAALLGGGAIVLCFPLLVAERIVAATSRARFPEAGALQALLMVPVIIIPLAGLLELGAGAGLPWLRIGMAVLAAYLCLVAAELTARSLANWFLPPPAAADARSATASLVALLLQPGRLAPDGLAAPIRTHLGLDFSRSWALRYARAAALPIGMALALIGWALTGVSLIALDQRGIYERLGAPVAVWAPGAHLGLPWPLGRVRLVDLGVVHTVLLAGGPAPEDQSRAEDPAPAAADRLWDRVHPAEVSYLIASQETDGRQAFQSVSVDLKVLYRVGSDDASALRAAYAVATPDALVRAEAGRLLARSFASQVLTAVLGDGRETMAETLRAQLQVELDRLGSGIELVAIVIEAIHPPPGAAEAYHNVQAAEIIANTAIATERGRAQATAAFARQVSTDLVDGAQGLAADTTGQAKAAARTFTADQAAAQAGGPAFLMERYFANLSTALAKSPLVIVDHRLAGPDAPTIDLRSFGAPPARPSDDD